MSDQDGEVIVVRLDPGSLDELAHRVADLVHQQHEPVRAPVEDDGRLLSAAQVAARWGIERSWVYEHADDLGVRRLGTGVRPRLRFDPTRVAAYLERPGPAIAAPVGETHGADVRRSPGIASDCAEGLPFRGRAELTSATQRSRRPGGA
ncbi:hypothetical protein [Conexibacter woesei]|uniref:hypothetical protein n=1 Tax=Conexibacter woesei TaxID=191495 RepID=UPI00054D54BA|nr:hypothetical protein [Conexibacter woesei]